jgi:hypothetical protein
MDPVGQTAAQAPQPTQLSGGALAKVSTRFVAPLLVVAIAPVP